MRNDPGSTKESGLPPKSNRLVPGPRPISPKIHQNPFIVFNIYIFGDILFTRCDYIQGGTDHTHAPKYVKRHSGVRWKALLVGITFTDHFVAGSAANPAELGDCLI